MIFLILLSLIASSVAQDLTVDTLTANSFVSTPKVDLGFQSPITLQQTTEYINAGVVPAIAIGIDGFPIIAFQDLTHANVRVMHCKDVSCSSREEYTVDEEGNVGRTISIVIGSNGFPLISYTDDTTPGLRVAACLNIECSDAVITILDTLSPGIYPSITVGDNNLPVVAYKYNTECRFAFCTNLQCTSANFTSLVGVNPQFTSLKWVGGKYLLSYFWNQEIILRCTKPCNTYDSILIGNSGIFSTSTLTPSGTLATLYLNGNYVCNDLNCTSGTNYPTSMPATTSYAGISYSPNGNPYILYGTNSDKKLYFKNCNNCNPVLIDTVAQLQGVVATGSDGLPFFAYYDAVNTRLKVAHCSDENCTNPEFYLSAPYTVGFSVTKDAKSLLSISEFGDTVLSSLFADSIDWSGDNTASNYIQLGSFQACWGITVVNATSIKTVTFPQPFKTQPMALTSAVDSTWKGAINVQYRGVSTLNLKVIQGSGDPTTATVCWLAFGRWK